MTSFLMIFIGGGLGACLRHALHVATLGYGFYPHILTNILGCFLLGVLSVNFDFLSKDQLLFLTVGFIGAFTTYSGYIAVLSESSLNKALIYFLLSNVLGFLSFIAGLQVSKALVSFLKS